MVLSSFGEPLIIEHSLVNAAESSIMDSGFPGRMEFNLHPLVAIVYGPLAETNKGTSPAQPKGRSFTAEGLWGRPPANSKGI